MSTLTAHDTSIELLADGRLANLSDWNEEVAKELARHDGLTLTSDHWEVINAMRAYYQEYNVSPVMKLLKKSLRAKFGNEKASDDHLRGLFPGGVLVQGSRIAGIPIPYLDAELERETYGHTVAAKSSPHGAEFEFEGRKFAVTVHGNLVDLHRWSEDLAAFMAEKEGIILTDDHWEVLEFLRKFYFEYGVAPMVRILMSHMAEELSPEVASREYLYGLFPQGPSRQGSRIAGLPEPQGCIDD